MKIEHENLSALGAGIVASIVITLLWKMGQQDAAFFMLTILSAGTFIRSHTKK